MQRPIIKLASTSGKAVPKSDMEAENRSVHCTNDAVLLERSSSHTLQQPLMRPRRTFAAAARAVRERTLVGSTQPTSPRQDNASALHPPVLRRRGGAQHHMETTYMRRSRRCPRLNFISCMPSVARGPCGAPGQTAQLPTARAGEGCFSRQLACAHMWTGLPRRWMRCLLDGIYRPVLVPWIPAGHPFLSPPPTPHSLPRSQLAHAPALPPCSARPP